MRTLNDLPEGWKDTTGADWSTAKGVRDGLITAGLAALGAGVLLGVVTGWSPGILVITADDWEAGWWWTILGQVLIQVLVTIGMMRLLFGVMIHYSGGLTGRGTTILVVLMAVAVILSKQPIIAAVGLDAGSGLMQGSYWMKPGVIISGNVCNWIGVAVGVVLFRDGSSILEWLGYD